MEGSNEFVVAIGAATDMEAASASVAAALGMDDEKQVASLRRHLEDERKGGRAVMAVMRSKDDKHLCRVVYEEAYAALGAKPIEVKPGPGPAPAS